MKVCQNCHLSYEDNAMNCAQCGAPLTYVSNAGAASTDHTGSFTAEDISQNKVIAMAAYVLGWFGVIIALLAGNSSPYVAFHVRQALKLQICSVLSIILVIVPFLGWIAIAIWGVVAFVLMLIGFFGVCNGRAKELPIISSFPFLK